MKYNHASMVVLALTFMVLTGCTSTTSPNTTESTTPVQVSDSADGTVQVFELTSEQMMYDGPGKGEAPTDSVTTTITVDSNNIITAVKNDYVAGYPKSAQYQDSFDKAIAAEIVGKSLDDAQISTIGGASNTSKAFNQALDSIRSKSKAA
jgi:uncharacterized protein with FMN-binding domain